MLLATSLLSVNVLLHVNLQNQFVDGYSTKDNSFPHSATLGISCVNYKTPSKRTGEGVWNCGASVINQRILITAAHCYNKCDTIRSLIRVGCPNRINPQVISNTQFKVHEDYNELTFDNDIALLMGSKTMKLGENLTRVALVKNPPKGITFVSGWGRIILVMEDQLMEDAEMKYSRQIILKDKTCLKYVTKKPTGIFCALTARGHPSHGNAGCALVVRNYIQLGIVSYKEPKRNINFYTNVPHHVDWIQRTIPTMYCQEDDYKQPSHDGLKIQD